MSTLKSLQPKRSFLSTWTAPTSVSIPSVQYAPETTSTEKHASSDYNPHFGYSFANIPLFPSNKPESGANLAGIRRKMDLSGVSFETVDNLAIRQAAREGIQTPTSTLPFIEQIRHSFGKHEIQQVQAHLGPRATASTRAMHAVAYATGNHIVFADRPNLRTVAHEVVHVIQQRSSQRLNDGIGQVGDVYEQHADAVADQVIAGKSVEDMLDRFKSRPGKNEQNPLVHHIAPCRAIQRLVGFEAELSVPTYGKPQPNTMFTKKVVGKLSDSVKTFVAGGLPYSTEVAELGTISQHFRLTSDHNARVHRGKIISILKEKGYITEDAKPEDLSSNLEYVTPSQDELGQGSNQKFQEQADAMIEHMDKTLTIAKSLQLVQLPDVSVSYYTGIPYNDLKEMVLSEDWLDIEKEATQLTSNFSDQVYLQATVGVLPSALISFYTSDTQRVQQTDLYSIILTHTQKAVADLESQDFYKNNEYIREINNKDKDQKERRSRVLSLLALRGILYTLFMYIMGDALYQSALSPAMHSTSKNIVPFLVKMNMEQGDLLRKTGTQYLREHPLPDDLVESIAMNFTSHVLANPSTWQEIAKSKGFGDFTGGRAISDYANFVRVQLKGAAAISEKIQVVKGKDFLEGDEPPPIVKKASLAQIAIPLEYRWLKNPVKKAEMLHKMMEIVTEVRKQNTKGIPTEIKEQILAATTKV